MALEPGLQSLISEMLADDTASFGGEFEALVSASYNGLSIKIVRPGKSGMFNFVYLSAGCSTSLQGEWRGKKYTFPHTDIS